MIDEIINQPQNIHDLLINIYNIFENYGLLKMDFLADENLNNVFNIKSIRKFPITKEGSHHSDYQFRSNDLGSLSTIIEYAHHSAPRVSLSGRKTKVDNSQTEIYFDFNFQPAVFSYTDIEFTYLSKINFKRIEAQFWPHPPRPTHPHGNAAYQIDKISSAGKSKLSFYLDSDGSLSTLIIRQIGTEQ